MIGPLAAILSFFPLKIDATVHILAPFLSENLRLENIGPHSLLLGATSVATTPLALFVSGFLGSLVMSPLTKVVGRKVKREDKFVLPKDSARWRGRPRFQLDIPFSLILAGISVFHVFV